MFRFEATEVDYARKVSVIYAYIYGEKPQKEVDSLRDFVSKAISDLPEEAGLRNLAKVYDEVGSFPSYAFLLERGYVAIPWEDVEAIAGSPNIADARATLTEARWTRAAVTFGGELDETLGELDKYELPDITRKMSTWISELSLAAHPRKDDCSVMDIYRARNARHGGIQFHVKRLDDVAQGIEPGTVTIVAGGPGHGKTTFMLNMAYSNAVKWGTNSVFFTLEVPKELIRLWLISRHSLHAKFEGTPPLSRMAIQKNELTPEQEAHMVRVVDDWENNPDYGHVKVLASTDFSTMDIDSVIERIRAESPFEAVYIDYIQKFKNWAIKGIQDPRERVNFVINSLDLKLAQGSTPEVSVVLGSQIGREYVKRYKEELKDKGVGAYGLECASDANEIEKAAYYFVALFTNEELKESGISLVQFLKHRGGTTIEEPFDVKFEGEYLFFGDDDFAGVGQEGEPLGIDLEDLLGGDLL